MADLDPEEIDEFLKKVNEVERQLKGLSEGTLDPKDVKSVDNSWAYTAAIADSSSKPKAVANQVAEEEEEKRKARELQEKWDKERAEREAKDERDRWWRFARMQYGENGVNAPEPAPEEGKPAPMKGLKERLTGPIDYSWWDKWAVSPDDAVSIAEREREAYERERAQDEAFEKANPGFVAAFMADQDKRVAAEEKKKRRAEALKEAGNAAFKTGNMRTALTQYVEAIKTSPFTVAALNNMSAAYLALGNAELALEFASRVLHIEKYGSAAATKALFRRGTAHKLAGRLDAAEADLALAALHDPSNSEVARDLAVVRLEIQEREKEDRVKAAVGGGKGGQEAVSAAADGAAAGAASGAAPSTTTGQPAQASVTPTLAATATDAKAICDRLLEQLKSVSNSPQPPASVAADSTAGSSARAPAGLPKEALTALASIMSSSGSKATEATAEDARVYIRACGLFQALVDALLSTIERLTTVGPPDEDYAAPVLILQTAADAMLLVAAAVENAKNRLIVLENGLLQRVLDLLCMDDTRLGQAAASSGLTVPAQAKGEVLAIVDASLLLVLTAISAYAPAVCRAAVAGHVFFQGQGRASGGAPRTAGKAGTASNANATNAAAGSNTTTYGKTDLVGRLHGCAVALASELDVEPAILGSTRTCAQILHQACLPWQGAAAQAAGTKGAKGSMQMDAATAAHVQTVTSAVDSFGSAVSSTPGNAPASMAGGDPPAPHHPVTAVLQLVTVLIGRSLFDTSVLFGPLMQSCVNALSSLAQREPLRHAFASPALPVVGPPAALAEGVAAPSNVPSNATGRQGGAGERMRAHAAAARGASKRPSGTNATAGPAALAGSLFDTPAGPLPPALHPLLDLLRLPVSSKDVTSSGGAVSDDDGLGPWDAVRGSALAALANACVPPATAAPTATPSVLSALAQAGAVDVLLGFLGDAQASGTAGAAGPAAARGQGALPVELRARAALLLGRLSAEPSAAQALSQPQFVSRATGLLKSNVDRLCPPTQAKGPKPHTAVPSCPPVEAQYQDGLIRVIAAGSQTSEECLLSFVAAGGLRAVVSLLRLAVPTLHVPGGIANGTARHAGVGNAAKILITATAKPDSVSALVQEGAVEVLVDALKAPSGDDKAGHGAAVRKNAAVALARMARDPAGHERLTTTRGLEILMQLGGKL